MDRIKATSSLYADSASPLLVLDSSLIGDEVLLNSSEASETYAERFAGYRLGGIDAHWRQLRLHL